MATGKTSTVTFRIAPALKEALRTAADHVRCLLLCCAEQFTRRFSRVVCSANADEAQRVAQARLVTSWPPLHSQSLSVNPSVCAFSVTARFVCAAMPVGNVA